MKYGFLEGKTINQTHLRGTLLKYGDIRLNGRTLRFEGYKTSILRFLIDNGETVVAAGHATEPDEYGTSTDRDISIRGGVVGKTASEVVVDTIRGAALGFATGASVAADMVQRFGDAATLLDTATTAAPSPGTGGGSRPGKAAYAADHLFGDRIIIDVGCYMPPRLSKYHSKVVDTQARSINLSNLAAVVRGMP